VPQWSHISYRASAVVGSGKAGLPGVFIASIPYLPGLRLRISKLLRRALRKDGDGREIWSDMYCIVIENNKVSNNLLLAAA
jgi:hypothetical protein